MISSESRMRDLHVRFDERRLETESRGGLRHRHRRKPPETATPSAYRHRASRRLYPPPANDPRSEAPASAKAAGNGYPLHLPPPRQSSTLPPSRKRPAANRGALPRPHRSAQRAARRGSQPRPAQDGRGHDHARVLGANAHRPLACGRRRAFDRALAIVVEAQAALPMAAFWGTGRTASSERPVLPGRRPGRSPQPGQRPVRARAGRQGVLARLRPILPVRHPDHPGHRPRRPLHPRRAPDERDREEWGVRIALPLVLARHQGYSQACPSRSRSRAVFKA